MTELTRSVEFSPSWNRLSDDPSKNYGIRAMNITFYVKGPKGAIQWKLSTGWYVSPARDHLRQFSPPLVMYPMAMDLGYHAHEPQYENQTPLTESCDVIGGGRCFYDGSPLNAELLTEGFLSGGADYLWPKLEGVYRHQFEGAEWPLHAENDAARARRGF